jgi:hypothetical protein
MALVVNPLGLQQALDLVKQTQFRLNTIWAVNLPTPEAEEQFIATQGLAAFATWHLAIDTDADPAAKSRYALPFGDFRSVHQSAVKKIHREAEQNGQDDIAQAAEEILDLFDRFNAC